MATKRRRRSSKAPSAAQRRARAAFAARSRARRSTASRPRRRARRRNPVTALAVAPRRIARRRRNPAPVVRSRRRRNPLRLGSASSYIGMVKEGLIGGAGAVAVDVAYGYIAPYLPASLQRTPGQVGVGDAVKAVVTVALGKLLSRATKGLSMTAAKGSLTVQAHGIIASFLPSTMTLGYYSPGMTVNANNRIGPNRRQVMGRYVQAGVTPMLNRYAQPGVSPMLSTRTSVMQREGYSVR